MTPVETTAHGDASRQVDMKQVETLTSGVIERVEVANLNYNPAPPQTSLWQVSSRLARDATAHGDASRQADMARAETLTSGVERSII